MANILEIPDKHSVTLRSVTIPVKTTTDDGEVQSGEFTTELPTSLADAVAVYGEKEVFKRFVTSLVVYLQAGERNKLRGGKTSTRTRASYLEDIGL